MPRSVSVRSLNKRQQQLLGLGIRKSFAEFRVLYSNNLVEIFSRLGKMSGYLWDGLKFGRSYINTSHPLIITTFSKIKDYDYCKVLSSSLFSPSQYLFVTSKISIDIWPYSNGSIR